VVLFRLIGVRYGELADGLVEFLAAAQVAADRGGVAAFGVRAGERPALDVFFRKETGDLPDFFRRNAVASVFGP